MSVPYAGLALQIVFVLFITVFDSWRASIINYYSVYPPALFELSLGILSTLLGLYGLIKRDKITLSLLVTGFGVLICLFFLFIYLLPEAGIPPAIPWLYSKN